MELHILLQQITNGLVLGSVYGLIAVGYTMVYGIIGMINFAHGDVYMVSAYLSAISVAILAFFGLDSFAFIFVVSLILVVLFTSTYGYTIERLAYRPLRGSGRLSALISAIGVSLFLQNFVQVSQGPNIQGIPGLLEGVIRIPAGNDFFQITYIQAFIVIAAFAGMGLLTMIVGYTDIGRQCRATQQDRKMASILGINVDKVVSSVFVIGAAMAALAGILVTLNYRSFDFYIGFITGLKAFTAAVLGGIGSLPGAMLGGLVLGMAEALFSGLINTDYKDVFAFSLLVLILIFRPSGLLGKPEIEKV